MIKQDELLLEPTTLWDFPKQSYGTTQKGNCKFNGVTPAGVILNLISRYTKEGDLVVDPMCGSGTTIDVCKEENRNVIGYDIAPTRPDIIQNDARKIPLSDNSVDMIFIDSPYGDNVRYSEQAECIGKISCEKEEFYQELEKVAKELHRVLKNGKVVGWVIGDHWRSNSGFIPVGIKIYQMLEKHFTPLDIICLTRRHQTSNTPLWKQRAIEHNFYLRGFKYLFVMKKKTDPKKCLKHG
ncbi:methyltransferase domain-containing protein [archaeon]|nr:methyltransferase domain-containing protein [Nanoarchaeota archaeon]MCG2723501.1 methyltransferase domain-containing protein [archaeon]